MSRVATITAEARSAQSEGLTVTGTVTSDVTKQFDGTSCYKCSKGAENRILKSLSAATGTTYYFSSCLRLSSITPSVNLGLFRVTGAGSIEVTLNSGTSKIGVWNALKSVNILTNVFAPEAEKNYIYELKVLVPAAGNGTVALRIYNEAGVMVYDSGDQSAEIGNSALSNPTVGHISTTEANVDVYISHYAANDSTGEVENTWRGWRKVVELKPVEDGINVGWTIPGGGTTNLWKALDNRPPIGIADTTLAEKSENQIRDPNSNTTDTYIAKLASYEEALNNGGGGLWSGDEIKLTQAVARGGSASTTSRTLAVRSESNPGADAEEGTVLTGTTTAGTDPTGWTTVYGTVNYSPTVNKNIKPSIRVRKGTASTTAMLYDMAGLIVEYVPGKKTYKEVVSETPGLVSLFPLYEESGSIAHDIKGTNSGSFSGSPTLGLSSLLLGGEGRSVQFTPTTQFVTVPDSESLDLGDTFSISAWIKPNMVTSNQGIVSKGNGAYYLRIGSTGKLELLKSQVGVICSSTISLSKETGYYVAATKSGSTVKLYVAKIGESLSDVTGTISNFTCENNAQSLNIAGDTGFSTERFNGKIQWVSLYSVALSAETILNHYESGSVEAREFVLSPAGVSVSSGSMPEELIIPYSISGTSISLFDDEDLFTMEEPVNGTSNSTGENTVSFEELTLMTINGESSSSGSFEGAFEATEYVAGTSSSTGSAIDIYERGEEVVGISSSTGSQEQILSVEEVVAGTSGSTFSETDEVIATESLEGTSVSSGSEKDETEVQESTSGSSNSLGSQTTFFEIPQPEQPIPSPVKPRRRTLAVRWKFFLCDSTTMELLGEIKQARGKNLQLALDKPGGCGFSVPLDYDLFKDVEEINHGIIAYRGDTPRYSGMIWNLNEDTENNSIAVQSVGWFETLNHRILRENVGYPPFSIGVVNAGQIVFLPASGSLGTNSYHPGGLLTIANAQRDTWLVEGTNKDVMQRITSYQRGQNIGQAITQLSEIEAGFDFWVDPLTRVLDITNWNEVPDKTEEIVFGYNWGNKNIEKLGRQFDPSVMANRVTALGKFGGGIAEDVESQQKYQLFEEMPQLSDVVDPNVLLGYAGGEVLLRNRPRVLYSFQPFPYSGNHKVPQPFDDYDIGDKIAFTAVKPPRIDIRGQAVRVYGMNLDITDEGNEKVTALQISP